MLIRIQDSLWWLSLPQKYRSVRLCGKVHLYITLCILCSIHASSCSAYWKLLASFFLTTFGVVPQARMALVSPGGRIGESAISPKSCVLCIQVENPSQNIANYSYQQYNQPFIWTIQIREKIYIMYKGLQHKMTFKYFINYGSFNLYHITSFEA